MTAQAARIDLRPALPSAREPRLRRPGVPSPRTLAVLVAALAIAIVLLSGNAIAHAATAICTAGEPQGTTCGEALVKVGFPT